MPQKKRGRPVEENPKDIRLDIRVTKDELQILDEYCKGKGVKRPQGLHDGIKALEKCKGSGATLAIVLRHFLHQHMPESKCSVNIITCAVRPFKALLENNDERMI